MAGTNPALVFQNYTKIKPIVPPALWVAARIIVLAITVGLVWLVIVDPALGLRLFWGLAIPALPAVLVLAPGLWRQVCPMAFLNQIPRATGFSLARDLPDWAKQSAFTIAVVGFFVCVSLRAPLLNTTGWVLGFGLIAVLGLAFVGGLVFKGRSGWCGTFCPLGPIQRNYGQAPLIVVRNGYCETCVGCQKNCYDFNPKAAVFSDLDDDDPRYAGQRQFFMAMMPGMILGYFAQDPSAAYGSWVRALILISATAASVGLYQFVTSFLRLSAFRASNLFAGLALIAFYAFAGPTIISTLASFAGLAAPAWVAFAGYAIGIALAFSIIVQGARNEIAYRQINAQDQSVQIDRSGLELRRKTATQSGPQVTDVGSGSTFPVPAGATLLEAMEAARIKINYGCRSGLCGADPVVISEGAENIEPAQGDELATLKRLGLEGRARLACMCRVNGPVVVDRDIKNAGKAGPKIVEEPVEDLAAKSGIGRVVIIGNGVAGLSVADGLRRASPSLELIVITDESHHYYNRMAIGRVIYGRASMDGLFLLPDDWYAEKKVDVWRNTIVAAIDRETKSVRLATGEDVSYDRLVLATGADANSPVPGHHDLTNSFVLRTAEDAKAIRSWCQLNSAKSAVVLGGGVLGVEAADALRHLGLGVTLLQRSDRLMDRQLDKIGAQKLANFLANVGVDVIVNAEVASFEGSPRVSTVHLADGRQIQTDLVVACAGIAPRTALARGCGLDIGRGIRVDPAMRTSDPHIYAVGDAAELPGTISGLWPVGSAQADTAVADMLGGSSVFTPPKPVVQLKCDAIDLKSFGDVLATPGDAVLTAEPEDTVWWSLTIRNGTVVGGLLIGPPNSGRDFGRLVKEGAGLNEILAVLPGGLERIAKTLEPA